MPVFQLLAVLSATLFTGAAIYINLVEHPARMECGTGLAIMEFGPSYRRASALQVLLALAATIGGTGAWLMGGPGSWLLGALMIFAVIPYTLIIVMPTNRRLLDSGLDRSSETTRRLLQNWGRLHAVRSLLSFLASLTFVCSVV
jgi:hypothetical protein